MTRRRDLIVVGVDGSSESARALRWTVDLARDLDAEVLVTHAAELGPATMFSAETSRVDYGELRARLEHTIRDEWCQPLRDAGVPYNVLVEDGGPAMVLMDAADRAQARMIVVGARGRGGFPGMTLGSVGLQLAQYADRPVTVVRG